MKNPVDSEEIFENSESMEDRQEISEGISLYSEAEDTGPLPEKLLVLPLTRTVFFPELSIHIAFEPGPYYDELIEMLGKSSKENYVGLFLTKQEDQNIAKVTQSDLYEIGTLARIDEIIKHPDYRDEQGKFVEGGAVILLLKVQKRIKLIHPKVKRKTKGCLRLPFKVLKSKSKVNDNEINARKLALRKQIEKLLRYNPLYRSHLEVFLSHASFINDAGKFADITASLANAKREELQDVLETLEVDKRMEKVLGLFLQEEKICKIQDTINKKIDVTISKSQREFFLREQLKAIKKELGMEKDVKVADIEKFRARLQDKIVPEEPLKVINDEIEKLEQIDLLSPEYAVSRNYLDWLTSLPWSVETPETHTLTQAKEILEKEHYGLEDVKKRILEFIAVGKLSGGVKGSILCLVGPPGVGKTSIGKSIAHALGREFFRFSVGGMRDEAEIKGHRRTYIGSMPGKMIQALKLTKTSNPLIMVDEVDKMGVSFQGDPASALLEVLDPEQNKSFLDHYLDVSVDLSRVLFVITANVLDTMPPALLDRMEVLRLSGYIKEEKIEIAKNYLIPRAQKEMGFKEEETSFTNDAIGQIINLYARESGVRNLENQIKKVLRKIALNKVEKQEQQQHFPDQTLIDEKTLEPYLGKPIYVSDRIYKQPPVGVAAGLAWTSLGGALLYIETAIYPAEKISMKLTGQAGDVMKESFQIAWTYAQNFAIQKGLCPGFFEKKELHMHLPEGATPKDGPSAGITMVTAILSQAIQRGISPDLAMTGELSLTGYVHPIGGLKEKIIAAKRAGIKEIICPEGNKRDYDDEDSIPSYLKEGIKVHFVSYYEEVFKIAFPG